MRPVHESFDPKDPPYYDEDPPACDCGADMIELGASWLCEDCDADEIAERAQDDALASRLAQDEGGEG